MQVNYLPTEQMITFHTNVENNHRVFQQVMKCLKVFDSMLMLQTFKSPEDKSHILLVFIPLAFREFSVSVH